MQSEVLPFPIMTRHLDTYPNRLRELRLARGLSQVDLGKKVGISGVQIGYLEKGDRELRLPIMRLLARALEVAPAELLSREDNPMIATPRVRQLVESYGRADEAGRQAIERVAESFDSFRPKETPIPLRTTAGQLGDEDEAPEPPRKRGNS